MKDQPLQMKLIFILNHYAHNSSSHFYPIIHLLETLAQKGVKIALIIEKCHDRPHVNSPNVRIFPVNKFSWFRPFFLAHLLFKLNRDGFHRVFTRISWVGAVISIIVALFTNQKTYYWQSTQGSHEHYQSLTAGLEKFIFWIKSELPFWFIKKYITHFVTGPESMLQYYFTFLGVSLSKIIVLYNDVDTGRFKPVDETQKKLLRKKWNIPENTTLFLFVHRFSPVRKTDYYFPFLTDEFYKWNPTADCSFFFAGGGPEKKSIETRMKNADYGDKIIFSDNVPNAEIHEIYQMSDIFIQPSWAEGFPRTLIEAMACGLPVVATSAGGVLDVLGQKQESYVVDVEDRFGFLQRISGLYNDQRMLKELSEENLNQSGRFTTSAVADMYIHRIFEVE
ncbi:MAG TPA: hypothetical protein DCQ58_08015 [Saprospirales bacterium]|nr:hypothetical protein [Saprospirales bacterium]